MLKVKDNFNIGKHRVVVLDGPIPLKPITKVVIGGETFSFEIPYDFKNSIMIDTAKDLIGQEVVFS